MSVHEEPGAYVLWLVRVRSSGEGESLPAAAGVAAAGAVAARSAGGGLCDDGDADAVESLVPLDFTVGRTLVEALGS